MTDAKVEHRCVALPTALDGWKIRDAVRVEEYVHNGMIELKAGEVPGSALDRDNANARLRMIQLEERRSRIWIRSVDRDPIEIHAQVRQIQSEVLQLHAHAEAFRGFRFRLLNQVIVKIRIIEKDVNSHNNDQHQRRGPQR